MITRKPITSRQILLGAEALWNRNREAEGRLRWDSLTQAQRLETLLAAQEALQAALPLEEGELRMFAARCLRTADSLRLSARSS